LIHDRSIDDRLRDERLHAERLQRPAGAFAPQLNCLDARRTDIEPDALLRHGPSR
jgi:hypothetical protein